jgi:hypothetical protein
MTEMVGSHCRSAEIVEVIRVEVRRGSGKDEASPVRMVDELWSKDGVKLAERDSWREENVKVIEAQALALMNDWSELDGAEDDAVVEVPADAMKALRAALRGATP